MSTPVTERDSRIDFIRGFFILMMCVDHLGHLMQIIGNNAAAKVYTYNSIGWSTGAEFFVFFSGYVIATVYSKSVLSRGFFRTQLRGLHRGWELYVRNGLVFLLVLALVYLLFPGNEGLLKSTRLNLAGEYGGSLIMSFMTFAYFPTYLEVLPLYMVLMAVAPAFVYMHARSRWIPISVSAAVWLIVQFHPTLNFHTPGAWHFNPFAWQFVFFLGMWVAKEFPLTQFDRSHQGRKVTIVLSVLALCAVLKLMDKSDVILPFIGALDIPGHGKPNVEPLRLAHFLLVVYLIGIAMPPNEWIKSHIATRGVARVGTHSLDCFSTSIVLCYLIAGVFSLTGRGTAEYFVLQVINTLVIVLLAFWFQWIKTPPWRAPPGGSAPLARAREAAGSDGAHGRVPTTAAQGRAA